MQEKSGKATATRFRPCSQKCLNIAYSKYRPVCVYMIPSEEEKEKLMEYREKKEN